MSDNPNVSQSDLQQAFESYHQIILPYLGGGGSCGSVGNNLHQYSTEEQVVGTWIDGRPIYEKTFTGSSYTSTFIIDSNPVYDFIIQADGTQEYVGNSLNSGTNIFFHFPYGYGTSEIRFDVLENHTLRLIMAGYPVIGRYYYTARYLKITDTPTV